MEELEICVFRVPEGSIPQFMIQEGGGEVGTIIDNLMVIFLSFLNF